MDARALLALRPLAGRYRAAGLPARVCGAVAWGGRLWLDVRVAHLGAVEMELMPPEALEPAAWGAGDEALLNALPPPLQRAMRTGDFAGFEREHMEGAGAPAVRGAGGLPAAAQAELAAAVRAAKNAAAGPAAQAGAGPPHSPK